MARDKAARAAGDAQAAEQGFEKSMTDLERIVEELESGDLTLDQSLGHYEKGMALAKQLTTTLDQAEKRIEKMVEAETADEVDPGESPARPVGEGELPF